MVQRRLGRGLDYLISGQPRSTGADEIVQLEVHEVRPNPYQPRRTFTDAELEELSNSILEHGVLQPVVVRRSSTGYELIAGERRLRACQRVGRKHVPALVRSATDDEMLELALVENIQRQDLNAIETARAYRSFIDRLGLTQDEAAHRLGKSRSAIANTLRLLDLPEEIQDMVSGGRLSGGHARALLGIEDPVRRMDVAREIPTRGLSVRDVERVARKAKSASRRAERGGGADDGPIESSAAAYYDSLEDRLRQALGTRVSLKPNGEKGRLVIEYFSREELERLMAVLLPS